MDWGVPAASLENAQEQMFGADRFMPAVPRLFRGEDYRSPRPLGESLQHVGLHAGTVQRRLFDEVRR